MPTGRFCWVPDWGGPYSDELFDNVLRAAYHLLPKPEDSN
jgi:hypothetical protein